jgi:hypothetical protein
MSVIQTKLSSISASRTAPLRPAPIRRHRLVTDRYAEVCGCCQHHHPGYRRGRIQCVLTHEHQLKGPPAVGPLTLLVAYFCECEYIVVILKIIAIKAFSRAARRRPFTGLTLGASQDASICKQDASQTRGHAVSSATT